MSPAGRQDRAAAWLLERGHVSEAELRRAERARSADPSRPELLDHLLGAGAVGRDAAHQALAHVFRGERAADLAGIPRDVSVEALLEPGTARRLGAVPLRRTGQGVRVAVCDPFDLGVLAELEDLLGADVPEPVLADAHAVYARIAETGLTEQAPEMQPGDVDGLTRRAATEAARRGEVSSASLEREVGASAMAQLADLILHDAVRQGASDVHVEFFPGHGWVRFRVDGELREWSRLPAGLEQDLVGHIKARSEGMDSANRLLPQDGRLVLRGAGRAVEFRVSTLPTVTGEKAVLRVLDRSSRELALESLGLPAGALERIRRAMRQSWGMILVTGPTGSGKSTTLYGMLAALARPETNVVTLEDPVERRIPMVTQVAIRGTGEAASALPYAAGLRAVLRQDPNVIMVGEIRDPETAAVATRAAMTGHLLLSTLHTNDASGALSRMTDLGVEPYNLARTLRLVVAQRLVRRICPECREPHAPDPALLALAGVEARRAAGIVFQHGRGCGACSGTGYRGRTGLYEVLEVTDAVRRLVSQGRPDAEIAAAALAEHMQPLRQAGWARIRQGETTLEEVLKET